MKVARLPANEAARLAELDGYDILDTLPEEAYDAITYLAAEICDAPIAMISLVDRDRQWFKSRIGLGATETPRDVAFCAHAILEPESLLIVEDATADERFHDNPLVTEDPGIHFYAGAPLVTRAGNALGALCVIDRVPRDLSDEQRQALHALSIQVIALLELRRSIDQLRRKQEELETVMQQREDFIATVSHEIRTPLSAVIGFIDVLRDDDAGVTDEIRHEALATISREAADAANLIEDLLVAARSDAGSLRVTSVEVNLPAQAAQVLEGLEPPPGTTVTVEPEPCRAHGDPARVRQIIRNLLTNAFRYGGPEVAVRSFGDGGRSHLEVSDDGSGIPAADQERVFERFTQASNAKTVAGSVGLGLPISRLLAEAMGGTLTYRYEQGRSVFDLELPAPPEAG